MFTRFPAGCLFLVLVATLSSCEPAATPGGKIPLATDTLAASTSLPTESPTPTAVVVPKVTQTLPPAAPMPGLVYAAPVPEKGIVGPFLVDASGQTTQLGDKPDPVLSPDRNQLLYSDNGDIWLQDLTTGKTRNLTYRTRDRVESNYQWWPAHPDLIVFHYQYAIDLGPAAGYLATVKPDGTNYLFLDEELQSLSPAALSPDGQSIAYDRGGQPWIYNYSAGKMPIFPKSFAGFTIAANPAWSPDSRQIAWQLFGMPKVQDGGSAVAILRLDTMSISQLHNYIVIGGSGVSPHHLAWSPDGKWLAVANQGELAEDGKSSLWVMRPEGNEEYHIGAGDLPIWNPDGTMLIYTAPDGVYAVKAGEWIPFLVTLPESAKVIDWVEIE
jgi:Tol biopolymer transport system component